MVWMNNEYVIWMMYVSNWMMKMDQFMSFFNSIMNLNFMCGSNFNFQCIGIHINVGRSGGEAEAFFGSGSVIFQKSRKQSVRGSICYIYIFFFLHLYSKTNIPNSKLIVEDMKTCIFFHKSRQIWRPWFHCSYEYVQQLSIFKLLQTYIKFLSIL